MSSLVDKSLLYLKNIWLDYYDVFKDVHKNARKRPIRATSIGLATVFVMNLFRSNEDLRSYSAEVISACNKLSAVVQNSRNPTSNRFIQDVGELNCHGLLRQIDLGFSTLIYKVDGGPELALYRYNCPHLRPSLKEFFKDRVLDFGVLGHWIMLETKMKDYDINMEEYEESVLNSM